jgi:hypothetical protein
MQSFLDPVILFFMCGLVAGLVRSDLEIPPQIAKFLSLYLLMALGLKGGFALQQSGFSPQVLWPVGAAMLMALLVPWLGYQVLRRLARPLDAAAIAAAYGSVSAVTFVTSVQYVESAGMASAPHMVVAMVLMETPAIIMALMLAQRQQVASSAVVLTGGGQLACMPGGVGAAQSQGRGWSQWAAMLRESLTNGTQFLLLGSLLVGYLSGPSGKAVMQPFAGDLFKGLLAFFLLDMGIIVARKMAGLKGQSCLLMVYALVAPLVHASIALALAVLIGLSPTEGALLMVLSASASYIVVPAVMRHALPEANASLYLGMPLGITFPFNILLGIPLYTSLAQRVL